MNDKNIFKVVTYNIHRGISTYKKRSLLGKISRVLASSNADIICLQEVWGSPENTQAVLEDFADHIWTFRAYGRNAVFPDGHQGNAVLSSYDIESYENLNLKYRKREPRGALAARIRISESCFLTVINTHLGLSFKEREFQINILKKYIEKKIDNKEPLIVTGDFNSWKNAPLADWERSLSLKEAFNFEHGHYARTYPSLLPFLRLDRIYFKNLELKSARILSELRFKGLSDHLPIEAMLLVTPSYK